MCIISLYINAFTPLDAITLSTLYNIRIVLFKGHVGILFDPAAAMTAFQP